MVASAQKNLLEEKLKLITELWNAGIKVCESAFGDLVVAHHRSLTLPPLLSLRTPL